MTSSRREFVMLATAFAASAHAARTLARADDGGPPASGPTPPGDNPAATAADDDLVAAIEQSEKIFQTSFTPPERQQLASTLKEQHQLIAARRSNGFPANVLAPSLVFDALLPGATIERSTPSGNPLGLPTQSPPAPATDDDLAFAPAWAQACWLRDGTITSARLTELCLARLAAKNPQLNCVVTMTAGLARQQAAASDARRRQGGSLGPLDGLPWGCKDIIDTAGITTTWGAEPWRDRVPTIDAVVVQRLNAQGAVLVAKLATGALAYGDLWFGGKTMNPWDSSRGASGSSAGPASAVAAGLVSFAIGTETLGSIVSPCMECGCVGLRPTFGRVARTGCMALSWSMDKIGAMARSSRDASLVLAAINGADVGDPSSRQQAFFADPSVAPGTAVASGINGLRIGVVRRWLDDPMRDAGDDPAAKGAVSTMQFDRDTIDRLRAQGATIVELEVPELPYQSLVMQLLVEGAAAFEELTRTDQDDQLSWQADEAWPNTFRRTSLLPAIEYVQTDRFRRQVMGVARDMMSSIDVLAAPSFAAGLAGPLMIGNATGLPSITVPTNLRPDGRPHGITITGKLFDEGTLIRVGMAIEESAPIRGKRP